MNRAVPSPASAAGLSPAWRRWYLQCLPAYWVFLFLVTHFPKLQLPGAPPSSDKVLHFVAFGGLAFLFWRFLEAQGMRMTPRVVAFSAVVLVIYAAIDEYLQQFVGRSTDLEDFLADVGGIVIALAVLSALALRRPRRA